MVFFSGRTTKVYPPYTLSGPTTKRNAFLCVSSLMVPWKDVYKKHLDIFQYFALLETVVQKSRQLRTFYTIDNSIVYNLYPYFALLETFRKTFPFFIKGRKAC